MTEDLTLLEKIDYVQEKMDAALREALKDTNLGNEHVLYAMMGSILAELKTAPPALRDRQLTWITRKAFEIVNNGTLPGDEPTDAEFLRGVLDYAIRQAKDTIDPKTLQAMMQEFSDKAATLALLAGQAGDKSQKRSPWA